MSIKPIRSDADYDATLEEIESLFSSEPDSEESDRLEVLLVLADDYQRKHFPAEPPDMQSAIEYELDKRGLTRKPAKTTKPAKATYNVLMAPDSVLMPDPSVTMKAGQKAATAHIIRPRIKNLTREG